MARGALFQDKSRRLNAEVQYNNSVKKAFDYIIGAQYQQDVAQSNNTYLLDKGGDITIGQFGGYAQLEHKFGKLRAVVAARADNHDLYGFNFIPKAALVYVTEKGAARITYGKGIAAPTILNLSSKGTDLVLTYVNFGDVNTYGFDASVNYAFTSSLLGTLNYSYFGYDIDTADPANDGNRDTKVNESDLPINTPEHKIGLGLNYSSKDSSHRLAGG
ncbi:MAG: TonB-dependent receptor [Lewinellaceae bacterium]|nr:TonB-dependent receptor [Lewinellaceae bacterium]